MLSEKEQGSTDAQGYSDSTVAVVRGPDGQVKQKVEPNDPTEFPTAPGVAVPTGEVIEHHDWGEVKGPDSAEWQGRDEELQAAIEAGEREAAPQPLGIDEIRNEGEEGEIKGPGAQWRQGEAKEEG